MLSEFASSGHQSKCYSIKALACAHIEKVFIKGQRVSGDALGEIGG